MAHSTRLSDVEVAPKDRYIPTGSFFSESNSLFLVASRSLTKTKGIYPVLILGIVFGVPTAKVEAKIATTVGMWKTVQPNTEAEAERSVWVVKLSTPIGVAPPRH